MARIAAPNIDRLHALLRLGPVLLALPQVEVRTLELAVDVDASGERPERGAGWLELGRRRCPVYALTPELELAPDRALDRGVCALIDDGQGLFGIVADAVERCEIDRTTALPAPMRGEATPIEALAIIDASVICVTSAARLSRWVGAVHGFAPAAAAI